MTRWTLALIPLLLACAPPSDADRADEQVAPADGGASRAVPVTPKPARQPSAPRKSKQMLEAGGAYYQYVDESGRVRFAASLDDVPERQRSTAGRISVPAVTATRRPSPPPREEPEARATNAEVVLYTTESCPYCKRAIAYLDKIGQDYVNKNVENDEDARDEYLKLTSGRGGVPVIVVGEQWMQGWNQAKLDEMLSDSR